MMESLSARCIRVTGLVFGLAAAAIAGGCMEARMLSSDEPYGIVTTFTSDIPDKVYPAYIAVIDGRSCSATKTFRAASLSRVPPHSGQACDEMYRASSSRTALDSVSR